MSMKDAISGFAEQLAWQPEIVNSEKLISYKRIIICGMGGSHLAADIIKAVKPELSLTIHEDYGLPAMSKSDFYESLVIASSYSGNTEEVLDAYDVAKEKGLPLMAIAVGGKLIEKAQVDSLPFIQMPDTGIQPRSALGYSLLALLKAIGEEELLADVTRLSAILKPNEFENKGSDLAEKLKGKIPIVYTSRANFSIAYNWKIKFNETGKIPAFYNVLPELNHNEMTGFSAKSGSAAGGDGEQTVNELMKNFHFVFIKDSEDHPRVQKRFEIIGQLYKDRGLEVDIFELSGDSRLEKIFNSLILGDWAAYYTSQGYGLESEQVPMVEEFKKLIV